MDASNYVLHQAGEADAFALARLRSAGALELGLLEPADAAAFELRARRQFSRMLRDERAAAWMLSVDGRAAGCACVVLFERLPYPGTSLHAEIAGVYVEPPWRRRGFARELVMEAVASARAYGVRRIVIAPTAMMREFYQSLGFAQSGWLANA